MRPAELDPLFAPLTGLAGVGDKLALRLAKLLGASHETRAQAVVLDLLLHLPVRLVDRRHKTTISEATSGDIVTLTVTVEAHEAAPRTTKRPYRVHCTDPSGVLVLVFFHADKSYLERVLPVGQTVVISGRLERYKTSAQMTHPDFILPADAADQLPALEPQYPLTDGLSQKVLRRALESALDRLPGCAEWQRDEMVERFAFPAFAAALERQHRPQTLQDLDPAQPCRRRLAYDEVLASQLAIALVRHRQMSQKGRKRIGSGARQARIQDALPFSLTKGQSQALNEIRHDLAQEGRMLRLLQGDVGAGKTVVALLAMAIVVEAGDQAALMAPTDLLARQHYEGLSALLQAAGLRAALLTGKDKAADKTQIKERLAAGDVDVVFGTHALFQEDVVFKRLGLVVIDEQHRFGVHQRLALSRRGDKPDMLVMTATPIPRTLVLSIYGDMDVSSLRDKPAGRLPIETKLASVSRLDEVMARMAAALCAGDQIYWVCPLVEASRKLELVSAQQRHSALTERFGDKVALLHGRLSPREKDEAMQRFRAGSAQILVATTVIEVGVDVPDASIMVIEHAERFGLAQLHQLRGRVGRGLKKSSCLLLFSPPLSAAAKARLQALRDSQDGFYLAEQDLKLRGEGDLLGVKQSGLPSYIFADLEAEPKLLEMARDEARYICATDPLLTSTRGQALRQLLYLFGKDRAVATLRAG